MKAKKVINKDKLKALFKNRNFVMAICVMTLTIITIGFSYASFFSVKTNSNNQSLTTGDLTVSYGSEKNSTLKNNLSSLSDELGMAQDDFNIVYIQNTGSLNSTFTLNIGYDMENFIGRSGYNESDTLTPLDYVRVAVYEYHGIDQEDTLVAGPISISDLPIYKVENESDYRYNRYAILFDAVGNTSSGNATKKYKIKTWLSDSATPAASYTYFYINTEVVAEVENAKMKYNFTGTLKNTSGTAIANAKISVQNGSVVSTTDASGNFTINGLYPGVYNLDITASNITYTGNLTVEEGNANAIVSLGTAFNGDNIFNVAKNYGTTVAKILEINALDTISTSTDLDSSSTYNLAPTYKFTGGAVEDVTGLKIVLDTTNKKYTISL